MNSWNLDLHNIFDKTIMKLLITLFILVASTATQSCPGFYANDLLQSGILFSLFRKTCLCRQFIRWQPHPQLLNTYLLHYPRFWVSTCCLYKIYLFQPHQQLLDSIRQADSSTKWEEPERAPPTHSSWPSKSKTGFTGTPFKFLIWFRRGMISPLDLL